MMLATVFVISPASTTTTGRRAASWTVQRVSTSPWTPKDSCCAITTSTVTRPPLVHWNNNAALENSALRNVAVARTPWPPASTAFVYPRWRATIGSTPPPRRWISLWPRRSITSSSVPRLRDHGEQPQSREVRDKKRSIVINKKIIELGSGNDWKGILELFFQEKRQFNNVNYASAMVQFGRISTLDQSDPLFLTFLDSLWKSIERQGFLWMDVRSAANIVHAIGKMKLLNPSTQRILGWISRKDIAMVGAEDLQGLTNIAWALATVGMPAHDFFAQLDARSDFLVQNGTPQSVANTMWAFATLHVAAPTLWAAIEARAHWLVQNGSTQNVANTVWAFATLKIIAPKLLAEIEYRSEWLVQNGTPQHVANTVWAFATLKVPAPKLLAAVDAHSSWLVENGKPQEVATTAWACAALKTEAPRLFSAIESRTDWLLRNGNTQSVANTVWAFATLKFEAPKLLAEIEARSDWMVQTGNSQDVANTVWAFATLKYEAPKLLAHTEARADWLVQTGTTQAIANTAWAFAVLRTSGRGLLMEIDSRSAWLVANGTTQAIANMAWAFAVLGYEATNFFDILDRNPMVFIGKTSSPQDLANLCYALVLVGRVKVSEVLIQNLFEKAIQLFQSDVNFHEEALCQFAQTQLFAKAWEVQLPAFPDAMISSMAEATSKLNAKDSTVSKASDEISNILNDCGFEHEREVPPDSTLTGRMMAIDIACKRQKVAIEYDGEYHFLKALGSGEQTTHRNGSTEAKRRLLKQLGWTVINLDFRDHTEARQKAKETTWLREELGKAGCVLL